LLKSQQVPLASGVSAEVPPYLFERLADGRVAVKDEFRGLHALDRLDVVTADLTDEQKLLMFAVGLEHGNSVIGHAMFNVLFLREHNRIARALVAQNAKWDDERLFQTARNILIVILLKLVVEEYIVHIGPFDFPLEAVPFIADGKKWNKSNWISIEFNLLYRWHSLVPNAIDDGRRKLSPDEFRNNNALILKDGIDSLFEFFSRARGGRIGLFNTPDFLVTPPPSGRPSVEQRTIKLMRDANLASYNAYRKAFGLPEKPSFESLTSDAEVLAALRRHYGSIDKLEWYVGIFAEDYEDFAMMGELMGAMVAYDAFTQALTNPLLSRNVFNERTFTSLGLQIISETGCLQDILHRNGPAKSRISFHLP
jgi:prostaglandin-endoperoxide synthase 2